MKLRCEFCNKEFSEDEADRQPRYYPNSATYYCPDCGEVLTIVEVEEKPEESLIGAPDSSDDMIYIDEDDYLYFYLSDKEARED